MATDTYGQNVCEVGHNEGEDGCTDARIKSHTVFLEVVCPGCPVACHHGLLGRTTRVNVTTPEF